MCLTSKIYILQDGLILESFPDKKARRTQVFKLLNEWEPTDPRELKRVIVATVFDTGDILPEIEEIHEYILRQEGYIDNGFADSGDIDKLKKAVYRDWPRMIGERK